MDLMPRDASHNEYEPVPPPASANRGGWRRKINPVPKRSRELLMLAKRCNNVKRTKEQKNPGRISAGSNFRERQYQTVANEEQASNKGGQGVWQRLVLK
jgi:hypothetical protein